MDFICKQIIILLQCIKITIIIHRTRRGDSMNKKMILVALILAFAQLQSVAVVTVQESTSGNYLINNGYSVQTADIVQVVKARTNGEEYYTADETKLKKSNKFVRFCRKFYAYFDPAAEDYSYYHHDTKTTPSYTDL